MPKTHPYSRRHGIVLPSKIRTQELKEFAKKKSAGKLIYVDRKTGNLVWEIPGLGEVMFVPEERKVRAVAKIDRELYDAGYLMRKIKKRVVKVDPIMIKTLMQNMRLGTLMVGVAEAKAQGKRIKIGPIVERNVTKIANDLGYKKRRPILSRSRYVDDFKRWEKVPKEIRDKKRIKRG